MPYIPKSKYKVSTTSGGEFMYAQSRKEYTGPYMILSNNLLLAGSSPNDIKASSLLIPLEETKKDNTYLIMEVNKKGGSVDYFNILNEGVFKKHDSYEPIITTKPSPTKEDYVKGFFYRYIVKRRNSDSHYYEVDKETHKSITNEEGRYDDNLHRSVKMKWNLFEGSGKVNKLEIRKIVRNTSFKRLRRFITDLEEYQLSSEVLNPIITPSNVNAPKPKLPLNNRKTIVEAQKGAIDLIKEKARKKYNKSSGNGSSPNITPSSGGGGGGY